MTAKKKQVKKRWMHIAIISSCMGGMLYMAQNCGVQEPLSELDTLDNFAAGSTVFTNQCMAPESAKTRKVVSAAMAKVIVLDDEMKHPMTVAVHDALSAVPDNLLMWGMRNYGTVIVSRDTTELCSAAMTAPEGERRSFPRESLDGCFVYFPKSDSTREVLNFNVQANPTAIQHSLLKIYGSAIAQLAPELEPDMYPALLSFQKNLGRAFIADLMDREQKAFDIKNLEQFLGRFDQTKLQRALRNFAPGEELEADPLNYFTFDPDERNPKYQGYAFNKKRFLDFTFAEAFDSYFCNNWGAFDQNLAESIRYGDRDLADSGRLVNTRARMRVFFPRSYEVFQAGIGDILKALKDPRHLAQEEGFGLQGHRRNKRNKPSRSANYDSPAWAGTKAFFGSIWGNTGGAAGRAYGRYTNRVKKSVDNYYRKGGKSVLGAVATGVGGGVADTYEEEVAQGIREQTTKRFEVQMRGGASINEAAVNSVLLAVGDQTGATSALEGVYGVDTTDARFLSTQERVIRGAQGGLQLIDTATGVGGLVSAGKRGAAAVATRGQKNRALKELADDAFDSSKAFNTQRPGTGLWEPVDRASAGPKAVQATREAYADAASRGMANDVDEFLDFTYPDGTRRIDSYAGGMAEDAAATTLKKGDKVYVVTDAVEGTSIDRLAWGADAPPHPDVVGSKAAYDQFVKETALPPLKGADRTSARVLELEVKQDLPAVTSTVAPNYGKQGGAQQLFMAYNKNDVPGTDFFKVIGDTADKTKPISVYDDYARFNQRVDNFVDAQQASTAANQAFRSEAQQQIRNWGKLGFANQVYQGVGQQASNYAASQNTSVSSTPVTSNVVFSEPAGAQPDVLSSPTTNQVQFNLQEAH